MGLGFRVGLYLLTLAFFFTSLSIVQKEKMVVTAHVMLSLFSFLKLPAWACRAIVPSVGTGDWGGVRSVDELLTDGNVTVRCRHYRPTNAVKDAVLIWAHGGGFVLGRVDEEHIDKTCRDISLRSGIEILSVDYRLAPEFSLMASFEDVEAVLRISRSRYKKIALGGESAGKTCDFS
jgi:acetyl esterase/lipase